MGKYGWCCKCLRFEIGIVNKALKEITDNIIILDIRTCHQATCISNQVQK